MRRRIVDSSAIGLSAGIVIAVVFWGLIALAAVLAGWLHV